MGREILRFPGGTNGKGNTMAYPMGWEKAL